MCERIADTLIKRDGLCVCNANAVWVAVCDDDAIPHAVTLELHEQLCVEGIWPNPCRPDSDSIRQLPTLATAPLPITSTNQVQLRTTGQETSWPVSVHLASGSNDHTL